MMNSKNKTSLFLMVFCLGFLFSATAFGRAPAVEPVTGISIDQYREADPKKDPGFNWHQDSSKYVRLKTDNRTGQRSTASYDSPSSVTMTAIFLLAIVAFPIALWFTLMKSFPAAPASTPEDTAHQSVTIDLAAERSRREEKESSDDDDHIHKAS